MVRHRTGPLTGRMREIVVGSCPNQERVRQSIAHYAQVRGIPAHTRFSRVPLVP